MHAPALAPIAKLGLVRKRLSDILPAPENDLLYRPVSQSDPEIIQLAHSIREHGLREPLTISQDGYIISGHRRFAACKLAGLDQVSCRVDIVSRAEKPDRFLVLLREHNRQRDKSLVEKVREELLTVDPDDAYHCLTEYRKQKARVSVDAITLRGEKVRSTISGAKRPMLDAIRKVLEDRREFLPITVRTIHYALLNDPPLKHAGKPGSVYQNDLASYKALDQLLTRARLSGEIDLAAIHDPTRPVTAGGG